MKIFRKILLVTEMITLLVTYLVINYSYWVTDYLFRRYIKMVDITKEMLISENEFTDTNYEKIKKTLVSVKN